MIQIVFFVLTLLTIVKIYFVYDVHKQLKLYLNVSLVMVLRERRCLLSIYFPCCVLYRSRNKSQILKKL